MDLEAAYEDEEETVTIDLVEAAEKRLPSQMRKNS
jgi:hypothetical protein